MGANWCLSIIQAILSPRKENKNGQVYWRERKRNGKKKKKLWNISLAIRTTADKLCNCVILYNYAPISRDKLHVLSSNYALTINGWSYEDAELSYREIKQDNDLFLLFFFLKNTIFSVHIFLLNSCNIITEFDGYADMYFASGEQYVLSRYTLF